MLTLLRALAPLLNVLAIVLITRRRRLYRTLRTADADAPERATVIDTSGLTGWLLQRFVDADVVHPTPDGRFWFDRKAMAAYRRRRRIRGATVGFGLLVAVALWLLIK